MYDYKIIKTGYHFQFREKAKCYEKTQCIKCINIVWPFDKFMNLSYRHTT